MSRIHIGSMASVIDDKNVLWMSNTFFNGLFCVNLDSREISCVGAFEGADLSAEELHKGAHINGKEIIFTPFYDKSVRIYHTNSDTYQSIAIPEAHKPPFSESVRIGQHIFFLSGDGCIWDYDMEEHRLTIDELSGKYKEFLDIAGDVEDSVYSDGFLLLKRRGSLLCRIDLIKHETDIIRINGATGNFQTALYGRGLYWFFLSDRQDIVSWDRETSEFISYKCKGEKWGKDQWMDSSVYLPYTKSGALFLEDAAWVSNYHAWSPVKINKEDKSIEPLFEELEGFCVREPNIWGPVYSNCHIVGEDIWFVPCYANLLLCYHQKTKKIESMELTAASEEIFYFDEIMADKMKGNVLKEGKEIYTLDQFIETVKTCEE